MKLITDDLIMAVSNEIRESGDFPGLPMAHCAIRAAAPVIVRKCIRELNAHHDDFIDGHSDTEYFETVDFILCKVRETLLGLIEEEE